MVQFTQRGERRASKSKGTAGGGAAPWELTLRAGVENSLKDNMEISHSDATRQPVPDQESSQQTAGKEKEIKDTAEPCFQNIGEMIVGDRCSAWEG